MSNTRLKLAAFSNLKPLVPGIHEKWHMLKETCTFAGLFKYVWPFSGHQVLKVLVTRRGWIDTENKYKGKKIFPFPSSFPDF